MIYFSSLALSHSESDITKAVRADISLSVRTGFLLSLNRLCGDFCDCWVIMKIVLRTATYQLERNLIKRLGSFRDEKKTSILIELIGLLLS